MPKDTIGLTLKKDGPLTLAQFAATLRHFNGLVKSLEDEAAPGARIEWVIEDMRLTDDECSVVVKGRVEANDETPDAATGEGDAP